MTSSPAVWKGPSDPQLNSSAIHPWHNVLPRPRHKPPLVRQHAHARVEAVACEPLGPHRGTPELSRQGSCRHLDRDMQIPDSYVNYPTLAVVRGTHVGRGSSQAERARGRASGASRWRDLDVDTLSPPRMTASLVHVLLSPSFRSPLVLPVEVSVGELRHGSVHSIRFARSSVVRWSSLR